MSTVRLHPDHLEALARDLLVYADRTDRLLARAAALGATGDVAGLSGAPDWATRTAVDVRRRVVLVRAAEAMRLGALAGPLLSPLGPAAAPGALPLLAAAAAPALTRLGELAPPVRFGRLPHEPLGDWVTRVLGESVEHWTPLPGDPVTEALRLLQTQAAVLAATAASGLASFGLAKHALARVLVRDVAGTLSRDLPLLRHLGVPQAWRYGAAGWLHGFGQVKAPGTLPGFLARPWDAVSHLPPGQLSTTLEGQALKELNQRSKALQRWFGRGWAHPDDLARLASLRPPGLTDDAWRALVAGPRGANNLLTVLRHAPAEALDGPVARLKEVGRVAGGVRLLGIGGQALATGISAHEMLDKDHAKAWREDKADYVSDVAATAFNGSLTVMMVAPSPWTAGAVAVTGIAYAGTEVWDHWDDITAWAGDGGPRRALDTAADAAGDVVAAGTEAAGKALDALKELDLNPF